jgi:hypothetical protein
MLFCMEMGVAMLRPPWSPPLLHKTKSGMRSHDMCSPEGNRSKTTNENRGIIQTGEFLTARNYLFCGWGGRGLIRRKPSFRQGYKIHTINENDTFRKAV